MKKIYIIKLLLVIIFTIPVICSAQNKELKKDTLGLEISHKWKKNIFKKDHPMQLNVSVKNTNNYDIQLKLVVMYYFSGVLQLQSDTIQLCITPNETIKGYNAGLNFSADKFTNEQINNDAFALEIIPFDIIKMRSCKEN